MLTLVLETVYYYFFHMFHGSPKNGKESIETLKETLKLHLKSNYSTETKKDETFIREYIV